MTKVPFERRDMLRPAEGPAYEVPSLCSHPYCDERQIERHHLVRRSELGGPYDWVQYGDLKIANIYGLCQAHHKEITENKSVIRWSQPLALFMWVEGKGWDNGGWEGVLTPRVQALEITPDNVRGEPEEVSFHPSGHPSGEQRKDVCPSCQRPFRKKTEEVEAKKPRRTWALAVPKSEQENGAEVLDTLLDEARKLMAQSGMVAYGDESRARYYILSAVLGLFVQHAQSVLSDG